MRSLVWLVIGVAGGFVVAHLVNKDPRGHEVLAQIDARIGEFADRISDAYRDQDARFAGAGDDLADAADHAASAVGHAVDAATDAVSPRDSH